MPDSLSATAGLHRPRRWAVLAAFTLLAGASQMLWLNFAPILTHIQARYGVSESLASGLIFVFPLLFVLLSLPAGRMVDARGYRLTVGLGAAVMTAGACLRILDQSFWFLFAGQVVIAIAQPLIGVGVSKLVADWFSEEQGAVAVGLSTVGLFLGMAAALAATPALEASMGLRATMIVFAAITLATAVGFAVLVHPNEQAPAAVHGGGEMGFAAMLRHRGLRVLFALSFLGLGVFNGLTTWLEKILAPRGVDAVHAGWVGASLILGGIVGAVIIPAWSDAVRRRKPFLIGCAAAGLALIYPLCMGSRFGLLVGLGAAMGGLFLPAYALLIEMSAQVAGKASAGAAASLLMLAGNAGGVVVVLAMPSVNGGGATFDRAVLFLVGLLGLTVVLALRAPETFVRTTDAAA
jgi:predicted MFS family arabinose efflux permease